MAEPAAAAGNPVDASLNDLQRLETILGETMMPSVAQARSAFRRDLPQLMKAHRTCWVAYHGESRVAIGETKTVLFQQCLNSGLAPGEFLVFRIEPEPAREIDLPVDV